MVIANHESSIDFINAAAFIDRRVHFVISNSFYNTLPIKIFLKAAGVIPKQQFQTSVVDIKKMKQVIDNDMPLVIYPVGLMSENGKSDPAPIATSKFLKMMNADVYVCYSKGSYLTKPKWASVIRKGKIDIDVYKLVSKEKLKSLSDSEVYNLIEENISYDDYENNKKEKVKYKNGDNLKGLEYVLFRCPHCQKEGKIINKDNNLLICKECGYIVKGNAYGLLDSYNDSKVYYSSPSEWYSSIYDFYQNEILSKGEITLEYETDILMINYKKKKYEVVGKGIVSLNRKSILLKGIINDNEIDKEFTLASFPYLPFIPGKHLDIQEGKDIYRLAFKEKYNITKFVMLVKIYHNLLNK